MRQVTRAHYHIVVTGIENFGRLCARAVIVALACSRFGVAQSQAQTPAPAASTWQPDRPLLIVVADVGQGDAALIITPAGKHILVDAGPSTGAMERLFFESTIDTLDLVIASHNHADHIGGMPWVFNRFVVRRYMDNGVPHATSVYRNTMVAVEREPGLQYLQATERTITVDSVKLHVLPPPMLDAAQNNNSVGVLVEYGTFRALFTGDSERRELNHWLSQREIPRVNLLKAAHHGASNGVTQEWIAALQPTHVIISVGRGNRYSHPAVSVVHGWRNTGAVVYRTDAEGDIMVPVQFDGTYQVISTKHNVLSAKIRN